MSYLPYVSIIIQFVGLVALIWYVRDTHEIWKTAQDQAEGQHKPCLTLDTTARDFSEAVLSVGDAVSTRILAFQEGNVVVWNVGNGVALNVRYQFKQITPAGDGVSVDPANFLPHIPPGAHQVIPVPQGILANKEYEFTATYESVGARRYESRVQLDNLVITRIHFGAARHGEYERLLQVVDRGHISIREKVRELLRTTGRPKSP